MSVAVVSELVVGGRELLEALQSYAVEVAVKVSMLRQDQCPTRHKAVDQRLLPHQPIADSISEKIINDQG